jgi:hypothetical protein
MTSPLSPAAFDAVFPDQAACWRFLEAWRWPLGPVCPDCGGVSEARPCGGRLHRWRCRLCGTRFHAAQGTAMEGTHLSLLAWFAAIHLLAAAPGLSSARLGVALGLRQKTAWSLSRRVRRLPTEDAALHRAIAAAPLAENGGNRPREHDRRHESATAKRTKEPRRKQNIQQNHGFSADADGGRVQPRPRNHSP